MDVQNPDALFEKQIKDWEEKIKLIQDVVRKRTNISIFVGIPSAILLLIFISIWLDEFLTDVAVCLVFCGYPIAIGLPILFYNIWGKRFKNRAVQQLADEILQISETEGISKSKVVETLNAKLPYSSVCNAVMVKIDPEKVAMMKQEKAQATRNQKMEQRSTQTSSPKTINTIHSKKGNTMSIFTPPDKELINTCRKNNTQKAQSLIGKGVDVTSKDDKGWTALMWAAGHRNTEIAKLLVEKGADVNASSKDGVTPLYAACAGGNLQEIKEITPPDPGIDPNHPMAALKSLISNLLSLSDEHLELLELLLKQGADPDGGPEGEYTANPLFYAQVNAKAVALLASYGADMNAKDGLGSPIFFNMVSNRKKDILKIFLDHNVDLELKDSLGRTVFDAFNQENFKEMFVLIDSYVSGEKSEYHKGIQIPSFQRYTGSGVCDACNKSIGPNDACLVPVNVFYGSKKYKEWLANGPMSSMIQMAGGDIEAYIANARAMDPTSHSAVCSDCIHMFE